MDGASSRDQTVLTVMHCIQCCLLAVIAFISFSAVSSSSGNIIIEKQSKHSHNEVSLLLYFEEFLNNYADKKEILSIEMFESVSLEIDRLYDLQPDLDDKAEYLPTCTPERVAIIARAWIMAQKSIINFGVRYTRTFHEDQMMNFFEQVKDILVQVKQLNEAATNISLGRGVHNSEQINVFWSEYQTNLNAITKKYNALLDEGRNRFVAHRFKPLSLFKFTSSLFTMLTYNDYESSMNLVTIEVKKHELEQISTKILDTANKIQSDEEDEDEDEE